MSALSFASLIALLLVTFHCFNYAVEFDSHYIKVKEELYNIISSHSGKSYEQVEKDSDRDYWMKSDEALAYGMIDEVLERK